VDENRRFDKIAGSKFERPKAGPEGVEHRDVRNNPLGDAIKENARLLPGILFYASLKLEFELQSISDVSMLVEETVILQTRFPA
jgi:hypothetical protein